MKVTFFFLLFFMSIQDYCIASPANNSNNLRKSQAKSFSFEFHPSIGLSSNYIWRGISQTNNGKSVQSKIEIVTNNGFYSNLFGSNASFTGTNGKPVRSEFQFSAGKTGKIKTFFYDAGLIRYLYPNATGPNFSEAYLKLGYNFFNVSISRSEETQNLNGNGTYHGTYYCANLIYDLSKNFQKNPYLRNTVLEAHIGRYLFSKNNPRDYNYTDYKLSLNKKYKKTKLELAWTDTNGKAHCGKLENNFLSMGIVFEI